MASANEKTRSQQYERLVSLMQEKPDIAQNYTKRTQEAVAAFLEDVTDQLNVIGPRQRDAGGWKKVWSDYKTYIKKKLNANAKEISGTGGGPFKQKSFTPLEEAVIALVKLKCSVDGIGALSFGTGNVVEGARPPSSTNAAEERGPSSPNMQPPNNSTQNSEDEENFEGTSTNRPRKALSSIQLLRKQVENQKKFFSDMKTFMQDTTRTLQDTTNTLMDTATSLKRVYRSVENVCEVEKKKLKEMQEHNTAMQKIALRKLEVKKQILELEVSKAKLRLD